MPVSLSFFWRGVLLFSERGVDFVERTLGENVLMKFSRLTKRTLRACKLLGMTIVFWFALYRHGLKWAAGWAVGGGHMSGGLYRQGPPSEAAHHQLKGPLKEGARQLRGPANWRGPPRQPGPYFIGRPKSGPHASAPNPLAPPDDPVGSGSLSAWLKHCAEHDLPTDCHIFYPFGPRMSDHPLREVE